MKLRWSLLIASIGCSSVPLRPTTDEDARETIREAKRLEAQGDLEGAREQYLGCLEFCPVSMRPLSAERLSEISKSLPETSTRVEEVAKRLETRVAEASSPSARLVSELAALISVSRHWESFGPLELLGRLRERAKPPVYAMALDLLVRFRPESFLKIDDRDAALLLDRVHGDRQRDEEAMRGHARVRPEDVDGYEQTRVERAVAYCAALLNAHRAQSAEEVLTSALSQARAPACEKLSAAAKEIENRAVVDLLCKHCSALPECTSPAPVQASSDVSSPSVAR